MLSVSIVEIFNLIECYTFGSPQVVYEEFGDHNYTAHVGCLWVEYDLLDILLFGIAVVEQLLLPDDLVVPKVPWNISDSLVPISNSAYFVAYLQPEEQWSALHKCRFMLI